MHRTQVEGITIFLKLACSIMFVVLTRKTHTADLPTDLTEYVVQHVQPCSTILHLLWHYCLARG